MGKSLATAKLPEDPGPLILDSKGKPMASLASSHSAAGFGKELNSWNPMRASPDSEILPELETMVARTRDLIRNHGLASGAVQTHLDHVIGTGLRLSAKPNWKALGITQEVAREWAREVEAHYRVWANDNVTFASDAGLRHTQAGRLGQGYRSYLCNGELVSAAEWITNRGFQFNTAIQMVDPDRMENPQGKPNSSELRGGVQLDRFGAATGYWFRERHPNEYMISFGRVSDAYSWKFVPRTTKWGRPLILHLFDQERPGQTRGRSSVVSVLKDMKMMEKFHGVTLQAAIVNAMYAAVIESSLDTASVGAALGATGDPLENYMKQMTAFNEAGPIRFDGVKIPHLFPGEKLSLLTPRHPSVAFGVFEEKFSQHMAAGFNMSYEQFSRDWSKSNYSSARAGLLQAWKFFMGRRHFIGAQQATFEYVLWLEEAIDNGTIKLPAGAPSFYAMKAAWCNCEWIGPGKDHIDPLKESKADREEYDLGVTTLERLCAARGLDFETVIEQRAQEKRLIESLGLEMSDIVSPKVGQAGRPEKPDGEESEEEESSEEETPAKKEETEGAEDE
jgi:lambda family phage portal protein